MNEEVPQSGASSFFCVRERKVIMSSEWLSVAEIFGEDVFNNAGETSEKSIQKIKTDN